MSYMEYVTEFAGCKGMEEDILEQCMAMFFREIDTDFSYAAYVEYSKKRGLEPQNIYASRIELRKSYNEWLEDREKRLAEKTIFRDY